MGKLRSRSRDGFHRRPHVPSSPMFIASDRKSIIPWCQCSRDEPNSGEYGFALKRPTGSSLQNLARADADVPSAGAREAGQASDNLLRHNVGGIEDHVHAAWIRSSRHRRRETPRLSVRRLGASSSVGFDGKQSRVTLGTVDSCALSPVPNHANSEGRAGS